MYRKRCLRRFCPHNIRGRHGNFVPFALERQHRIIADFDAVLTQSTVSMKSGSSQSFDFKDFATSHIRSSGEDRIRTYGIFSEDCADLGSRAVECDTPHESLNEVVRAWPTMPADVRAKIVAIARQTPRIQSLSSRPVEP